jgi:uncharacterized ferredoxin-like protein
MSAPTVHLQGIGPVFAKPASDLVVGDRIMYNFGSTATVTNVVSASAAFLSVTVESNSRSDKGKAYTSRIKKTRLLAVTGVLAKVKK